MLSLALRTPASPRALHPPFLSSHFFILRTVLRFHFLFAQFLMVLHHVFDHTLAYCLLPTALSSHKDLFRSGNSVFLIHLLHLLSFPKTALIVVSFHGLLFLSPTPTLLSTVLSVPSSSHTGKHSWSFFVLCHSLFLHFLLMIWYVSCFSLTQPWQTSLSVCRHSSALGFEAQRNTCSLSLASANFRMKERKRKQKIKYHDQDNL